MSDVFAYERFGDDAVFRILLNFGGVPQALPLSTGETWTVLLSTRGHRGGDRVAGAIALGPDEGLILQRV